MCQHISFYIFIQIDDDSDALILIGQSKLKYLYQSLISFIYLFIPLFIIRD